MPAITIPGTSIKYGWQEREKGWGPGMNTNLLVLGVIAKGRVLSRATTTPPSDPDEGDAYIIPAGATGAWSGRENEIAAFFSDAWVYIEPVGAPMYVVDDELQVSWNGTAWEILGGIDGPASSTDKSIPVFSGTTGKALAESPLRTDDDGNIWGNGSEVEVFSGTALTITAAHAGKVIWCTSADAVTVTLPEAATEELPVGFSVAIIQAGDGQITLASEGADVIVSADNYVTSAKKGAPVSVLKPAAATWWLGGQLAA